MKEFHVEDDNLFIESEDDKGNPVIEVMPMLAIASRMEILGLDDPGVAIQVLKAEHDLVKGDEPYNELLEAIATSCDNESIRLKTLGKLPIDQCPDTRETFELKEYLKANHAVSIEQHREVARKELAPAEPIEQDAEPMGPGPFPPQPGPDWIDPVGKELVLTPRLEGLVLDLTHTPTKE